MSNIAWFKDLSKKDIPSVGGKGANLGEMFNNHFPVPPGFVVTAQAFKEFLDQNRLQEPINDILNNLDINDNEQLQDVSEKIQELILNAEMPIEIKNEIINSYEHLNVNVDIFKTASKETINMIKAGRSLPYVAVRSSATAEDLPSISKDEHILIKINDRAYFRKMEEVYELIGCCKDQKVEIPAMENNKIKWMKVESLYKHKANNDKLYKIITKTGREIIVSPNHTLIVLDETTLNPKKVKSIHDLKGNEKLPVINHLPNLNLKNETINILDYIKGQDIVKLNNELKIKNNSSNWKIQNGFPKQIKITSDLAYFLGLYCAEGTIYKNNQIIITNKNEKVIQKIIDYISNFGLYNNQKINKNSLRFYNKILARFLKEVAGYPDKKISGKGNLCRNKKVPEFIFGWNSFLIGEFLKGCFDGDGHAGRVLEYCSTSKLLISGIIKLLELLGIEWYLRKKENAYVITIKSHHYEKFSSLVGFYIDEKQNKLNDLIKKFNSQQNRPEFLNTISITPKLSFVIRKKIEENLPKQKVMIYCCPYCSRKLNLSSKYKELDRFYCKPCKKMFYGADAIKKEIDLYINYDKNGRFLKDSVPWNKSINSQKKSMKKLKNDLEKNNINFNVFDNSVKWDEIEKIKEVDYNDYVYDFSVPEVQNFAAGVGGIITHNSASFAGQQATYLNVRGNERVAKAVQQCWASLYKARAIYYREKNNFEHEKVLIAVIVQKMINSEKAGVAFSINPTTNNENEIVIEAAYGLGDAVVSGSINPNTYLIDKNSLEIKDKKIADQEWMLIRDENLGRTIKKNVWASLKEKPVMTDDEIKKLAGIVRRIEKHYGKPQDIEFAIEEGRLYIVQARPVTTQKKVTEEVKDEVQIGSNKPILEGLPASPGAAFGRVKIIHNPNELNKIEKGDILVAEMTNPDYVPAMERAAAIVTDDGGTTCFSGDTKILTNKGFLEIREVKRRFLEGEGFYILSYDYKNTKPKWKKIVNAMSRLSNTIRVSTSQTGRIEHNILDLTPDHEVFTFENRKLIKKEINDVLLDNGCVCLIDSFPKLNVEKDNPKLSYLAGALLSDGYIRITNHHTGNPRRGQVVFTQKETEIKTEFIKTAQSYFLDVFNEEFNSTGIKVGGGLINGRQIYGSSTDFVCNKLAPALELINISQNLAEWTLVLSEVSALNFLAGLIDGDGCLFDNRLHIYVLKENILQGIVISCLKLGIIPQITTNRNIHHVQILERIDDILDYTKRVRGKTHKKVLGTKLLNAKQILSDVVDDVNLKGRIKPYVKNNLLIDSKKIIERIIPIANIKLRKELFKVLNSNTRMHRVKKIKDTGITEVFNLEVEADEELEHNYVVFTKKYTPLLVSNCHAAIVSRELGIPAVVGTEKATSLLKDRQMITVDGTGGKVYEGQLEIKHEEETIEVGDQPETITKIKVIADLPDHLDHAAKYNPDGVGLVRIEFMIVKGGVHPAKYIKDGREEEYIDLLVDGISKIGERFSGKPVWVRTSDLRSDEYRQLDGGNDEPDEDNPMLGFHGIRRSLVDDGILRAEFKAIKRIHEMGLKNVGIMLPFVISVDEVKRSKVIMREVGLEPLVDVDFGVMIETPASVQIIDLLCDEGISFISFGTNDLTQTTLGVDRNNGKLSDLYDEMHPAVLREIAHVVKICKEKGVETSICGQAGSNPEMAKFLVKIGIDSISPNADAVAKIRNLVAQEEKKLLLEAARQKL